MGEVKIIKKQGGLGIVTPSADGVAGLIATSVAGALPAGGFVHNTAYKFTSLKDAEDVLITETFDAANFTLIHRHIKDFFTMVPNGTLYFISSAGNFASSTVNLLERLVNLSDGELRVFGEVTDLATLTPALLDVNISAIQTAIDDIENRYNVPMSAIVEGRITATAITQLDELNSPKVSVCCAQDADVINLLNGTVKPYQYHGLVGLLLGTIASANVNENIGWVEKFNLQGKNILRAALFGSLLTESLERNADDKRVIFLKRYNGYAGLYFNDTYTCTTPTNDFAFIENNRVWDKASRAIRTALTPSINSPMKVDPTTGKLSPEIVKSFELKGRRALDTMLTNDELSGVVLTVDPNQNILSTSEFELEVELIPVGVGRILKGTIGFSNPF